MKIKSIILFLQEMFFIHQVIKDGINLKVYLIQKLIYLLLLEIMMLVLKIILKEILLIDQDLKKTFLIINIYQVLI